MASAAEEPVTAAQVTAGYDLRGRHALVTDAGGPLGWPVAKALAVADATVVVTDPDPQVAAQVATRLRTEVEGSTVLPARFDPGSIRSAAHLGHEYLRTAQPLSVLALCGIRPAPTPPTRTTDGFETHFGHRLAEVTLATSLLPALRQAATGRIVIAAAVQVAGTPVDLTDPNFLRRPYDPDLAYGQAQAGGCLFAAAFTQHYGAEGITCNAADPGWTSPGTVPPPEDEVAAAPLARATMAPELDAVSGCLLRGPDGCDPLPDPATPDVALRWWELAEHLIRSVPR